MKIITIPETTIESLIEELESALKVCYNVDYLSTVPEKTSAYAVGYSEGTIENVLKNLQTIKSKSY